ncbi:MAG: O-antigen ligase family protein [Pseudomonadota bacterium]
MTYLAFALYPIAALALFRCFSFVTAIPASLMMGYLLLPAAFAINPPFLPELSKVTMSALVPLVLAIFLAPKAAKPGEPATDDTVPTVLPGWLPRATWARICLALIVLGPVLTALTNRESVTIGAAFMQGLSLFDAANMAQMALVTTVAILIGRRYLATEAGHRSILFALVVAGLLYSLPTLAEVRLSPQIHKFVYGYFQHSWIQHLRGDGFRPIVFMRHGLVLSLILCLSALAIIAYMRAIDGDRRVLYFLGAAYMTAVLFLSKSLGMMLVACVLVPVLLFASVRAQLVIAALIVGMVLTYPAARFVGINPLMIVAQQAEKIDPTRAASLRYRLDAEDAALERFSEKPFFGWGGWGRAEPLDESGGRVAARDGHWIIYLGQFGMAGHLGVYGLLCLPVLLLALRRRECAPSAATSGLCIVMAANALDLIPNAGLMPITWLIAGALLGHVELGHAGAFVERTPREGVPGAGLKDAIESAGQPHGRAGRYARVAPKAVEKQAPFVARMRAANRKALEVSAEAEAPTKAPTKTPYSRYAIRHGRKRGAT